MFRAFPVILATMMLDAIGIGLVMPILPGLLRELGRTGDVAGEYGLLITLYALMQFLFAPLLGLLSDRFGRRPVVADLARGRCDRLSRDGDDADFVGAVCRARGRRHHRCQHGGRQRLYRRHHRRVQPCATVRLAQRRIRCRLRRRTGIGRLAWCRLAPHAVRRRGGVERRQLSCRAVFTAGTRTHAQHARRLARRQSVSRPQQRAARPGAGKSAGRVRADGDGGHGRSGHVGDLEPGPVRLGPADDRPVAHRVRCVCMRWRKPRSRARR